MVETPVSNGKETGMDTRGYADGSRKYWFKKGVVNNPNGRPKGSKSLKEFAREYLLSLTDDEKSEFLNALPPELVFRMAEGNPHSTSDETVKHVIPQPIMKLSSVDVSPSNVIETPKMSSASPENGLPTP